MRKKDVTEKFRKKMSELQKKRWQDETYKKKMSKAISNSKKSKEAKDKMKEVLENRWNDKDFKKKASQAISKAKTGVKFTEEHKENLKKNHKGFTGRKMSEKQKKQISKKLMGHKPAPMKVKKVRHHKYLAQHSDEIMELSVAKHNSIHRRAYDYIYATQGEKGLDKYIKWYDKTFGLD